MTAFTKIIGAINDLLSIIPALVWAIALLLAMSWGGVMHHERDSAVQEADEAKGALTVVRGMIKEQKRQAAVLLAILTAEVKAAQSALDEFSRNQEKADANKRAIIADQARRLTALAAGNGGKLRDPNATGCGGGGAGPQGPSAPGAVAGAADVTQAPGLLSAQLSGLLLRLTGEADDINAAYESCRADALTVRKFLESPPPGGATAAPAAP